MTVPQPEQIEQAEQPDRAAAAVRIRAFVKACRLLGGGPLVLSIDGAPLYLADLEALLDDREPGETRTGGRDWWWRPW